jgi:hypothetical protein
MAAGDAQIVREMKLAAIRAFLVIDRLQRMVAAAHIALRRRGFSFRDGHSGTCSIWVLDVASAVPMVNGRIGRGPWRPVCPLSSSGAAIAILAAVASA